MLVLDVLFLLVLAASVLLGAWRGLVFEVLSVAGWVLAFFLAQWYGAAAAAWLPLADAPDSLRHVAGFVLVFIATVFAAGFVAWLVKRGMEQVGLRPVDRTLGAGFGLLRGAVVLLAVALVVNLTPLKQHDVWVASVGAGWLNQGLHVLKGAMPAHLVPYFP